LDTGAQGLYIAATDAASGKTAIALGVAEAMSRRVQRLGVFRPVVAGGRPNVLDRLTEGVAVIAPGDRTAGLVPGLLAAHQASNFPSLSAVFLTGGFTMPDSVRRLLDGWDSPLPIISTAEDTLQTAQARTAREVHAREGVA
jgi:phosphate acetyltransferase